MNRRWLAVCALMTASALSLVHAVDFQFGWKPGMTCKVDHVATKSQAGPHAASFTMMMRASSTPDGRMLIEVLDAHPSDAVAARELRDAGIGPEDLAVMFQPGFFVKDGKFAALRDAKPFRNAWHKVILAHPTWSKDRATVDRVLDTMASPAMQETLARTFWNTAVENWIGLSAEVGDEVTYAGEDVLPVGQIPYKASGEIHFVGMRPCRDGDNEERCALVRTTQQMDPSSARTAVAEIASLFGARKEDFVDAKIDLLMEMELLSVPSTLEPSRVRLVKNFSISDVKVEGWKDVTAREVREWTFDCTHQ